MIGPQGARSAFSGCCSQSEPVFPVSNLPAGGIPPPPPNRRWMPDRCANSQSPPCRRFPEGPRTDLVMCVFRSPVLFSARSQHTQRPDRVWWFCRPLVISAFQRHGTQHLLHCRFPSSFHLAPVCRQLQRAYYLDFARVRAPRSAPSGVFNVLGVALAA